MKIRSITAADRAAWSQMRCALWPQTADQHLGEIDAFFAGESIDVVEVLVCTRADQVLGFLEINIRDFAEGSRKARVPYVEAWYVAPEARKQGVGLRLMRAAEDWARAKGFSELASDTEIDNTRSIELHRRLGFEETERIVCFLKSLDPS